MRRLLPGALDSSERDAKLRGLLDCGIHRVISLMESDEKSHGGRPFEPYAPRLLDLAVEYALSVECLSLPIRDSRAPTRPQMEQIIATIGELVDRRITTYLHCWGGHGRSSTVVACYLIQQGNSRRQAIEQVQQWRAELPKSHYPYEGDQEKFILSWSAHM